MAATGYTPISLYYSTTASATPLAANLANGELAININTADGKLYYKDSAGVVQLLASKLTSPANGGTGVANNAASTLTISGNFATTLTLSGTTSVTLPTTGTLATLAGSETFTNKTLTNPTVNNYTEGVVAIGNSGTTQTISLTNGTVQTVTLTGNCTFTMPTATAGKSFILMIVQDSTGGRTATFTSVKWPAGTAPTITTTASTGFDIISFFSNGTNWYGSAIQNFS